MEENFFQQYSIENCLLILFHNSYTEELTHYSPALQLSVVSFLKTMQE